VTQVFFYFDQSRCTGCGACAVACKDWNNVPAGAQAQWRRVYSFEAGRFPQVDVVHLCLSCCHCAEPACAKACPTGAIRKRAEDGAVLVNRDICRGCRSCQTACPYGAPQYAGGDYRMMKCTFCVDRQAQGLKPACVDACPYFALDAGTAEMLQSKYGVLTVLGSGLIPGIDSEHEATRPCVFVKPRSLRADGPLVMRRNGGVVSHLRAVPGPPEEEWRARARVPFANKPRKVTC
jgi:anaerobic dimethyl sulfoxide reductase subunit B (iron-sulfur subunit)